ncbi:MAG: hypothetical protein K0U34_07795 [Alphaproteobacteria bacterium]|nr:hypothetical protein [Alphaproteobacteria bacterium]
MFYHARLLAVVLFMTQPTGAKTSQLDTCLSLWRQSLAAQTDGTAALLTTDPAIAGAQLSKNQLAKVKAYIDLIERLKFRCRRFVPPPPSAEVP